MLASLLLAVLAPYSLEPASAASESPIVRGEVGAKLDGFLERCVPFGFSGSALVVVEGKVVLSKGYGLADPDTGLACAPDTLYDIGSLTKQFTAAAILRLEEEDVLALSDPISKHLPGVPADKRAITIEQLLTHSSGIDGTIRTIASETHDRDEALAKILASKLASKPGTRVLYSNTGYDLLAILVEIVTKKPFEEALREQLFVPARMSRTGFCREATLDTRALAAGYEDGERVGTAAEGWYSWALRGAGGVITSIADLARWEEALQGERLLSPASKVHLTAAKIDGYACGWRVRKDAAGRDVVEHGGTTGGFEAKYVRYPRERTAVVVLANNRSLGPRIPDALTRIVHGEEYTSPPAVGRPEAGDLAALAGEYVKKDASLIVTVDRDGLSVAARGQPAVDALLSQRSDAAECTKALRAASAFVDALVQGSVTKIDALLAPNHSPSASRLLEVWPLRAKKLGAFQDHEPLGWIGPSKEKGAVHVRLVFERGSETVRIGWTGQGIQGVGFGGPCPLVARFLPVSRSRFVVCDLFTLLVREQLEFDRGSAGIASSCTLESGGSKVRFERRAR